MKTLQFNVTGKMNVPDSVIYHFDVAGKLYALEINDIMYMLQVCFVAEGGAWGHEIITDHQEMENHSIKNVRYDDADFVAIEE
jgi:hypothetical protein